MGMRLIDAYALQDNIHKSKMQNPHKDAKTATNHELEHDHFMQMVVLQPTAQEEIVRCKDCIYCKVAADKIWREDFGKSIYECDHLHLNYVEPDWFCADGKRKEGR